MTLFGLGNPTDRYAGTRHNVGFMVIDELARRLKTRSRHLPGRKVCRRSYVGQALVLVKPLLYMNESGRPVRDQLAEEPDEFLVVCDDMALPFGRLRLRPRGSDGGHKGLASIIYHLGTADFPRLRIGIGAPPSADEGVEYVLTPFPPEEARQLPDVISRAADCCLEVLSHGLQRAMNRYNPDCQPSVTSHESQPAARERLEIGNRRSEIQ